MWLGVPVELALYLFIGVAGVGIIYHGYYGFGGLIPGIPVWIGAAILCKRDVNGIRVFGVKSRLITLYLDAYRWQGALSPSPWPRNSKIIPYAV